jgi:protein disulfide-isomerase A1
MIKLSIILSLAFLTKILCTDEEDYVLILDDRNFDDEIKKHESIMVEFYAPWCGKKYIYILGHCQQLEPEYKSAADILRANNPPFYLAKVDATENALLSQRFNIESYPTIKFMKNGEWMDYDGDRTAQQIVNFIRKRISPASTLLNTKEQIEKEMDENNVIVVFFGEESSDEFKIYSKVALSYEEVKFTHVTDVKILSEYKCEKNHVLILKNFDEKENRLTEKYNEEKLKQFVDLFSIPIVSEFNARVADAIFARNKVGLFYMRDFNQTSQTNVDEIIKKIAIDYRGKLYFVITDIIQGIEERLAEYLGVVQTDLPQLRITNVVSDETIKHYIYDKELIEENIRTWIGQFLNNELSQTLKSEEIPETQNDNVYKVVGKTFNEIVYNPNKHVLLEYYASWCGHCKNLEPIYERVAANYKNNDKILIAKIEATLNELETPIDGFPTIKLYPADDKLNPIVYNGERNFESIVMFIEEFLEEREIVKPNSDL